MRLKRLTSYRLTKNQLKLAGLLLGLLIALVGQSPARQSQAAPPGCPASAPTISDIEKTNITDTTAKISWTTNYSTYGEVNYATAAGPPYSLTKADTVSGLSHSVTLDALAPNTTYHFSIMAESAPRRGCDQTDSPDDSFVTLGAPPPPPPNTLTLSNIDELNINPTIATIVWTTNIAASSKVRFGTTVDYEDERTADGEGPPLNPAEFKTAHSIALGPLTPDTLYHYQVESTSAGGQTQRSIDRTFRTAAGSSGITLTIFNLGVYAECGASCQNPGDVTVRFQFETNDATNATARWGLNPGPPYPDSVTEPLGFRAVHDITRVGLNPNTTYHYQITVVNAGNSTYTTGDITFDTPNLPNTHTFTTGACTDANNNIINIGACSADRLYCDGGVLVANCSKCGYTCNQGETCTGAGICVADPGLSGNAYQCNKDDCYDQNTGQFLVPAAAGCWESWPRCSANTVLKVKRDRVCDQWITCASSVEITEANTGAKMDLCTGLGGCASLGPGGTCNEVFGLGQCENDPLRFCNIDDECGLDEGGNPISCLIATKSSEHPLPVTYKTPKDIDRIQNLTGSIVAGLDWGGATTKIEGMYPWFLAPQYGEVLKDFNLKGDFEFPTRTLGQRGISDDARLIWHFSPGVGNFSRQDPRITLEEEIPLLQGQNNLNHVLRFKPLLPQVWVEAGNIAQNTPLLTGFTTNDYFVTFRMKTLERKLLVRPQFYTLSGFVNFSGTDIEVTDSWQTFRFGPIQGVDGAATLRFYFDLQDNLNNIVVPAVGGPEVLLDDVRISQALEIRPLASGQYEYAFPSCRLYPKAESEACTYIDENGARYTGQSGYCLERDPKNPSVCISWWPVDGIRGEENAFASERSAGFSSGPLYYCLQSRMYVDSLPTIEEGCMKGTDGSTWQCETSKCIENCNQGWGECSDRLGDPCPPGYVLDGGYFDNGFACPRDSRFMACAGPGENDDWCSWRCTKVDDVVALEYSGRVRLCFADHRIPCTVALPGDGVQDDISGRCLAATGNDDCELVLMTSRTGLNTIDQCAIIAKVADFGQNTAWVNRVKYNSDFVVPPFNGDILALPPEPPYLPIPSSLVNQYGVSGAQNVNNPPANGTYQLDYPFGRVVTPENMSSNPGGWPAIGVRTTCDNSQNIGGSRLYCEAGKAPGEVAGVTGPYAWTSKPASTGVFCDLTGNDSQCVPQPGQGNIGNGICQQNPSKCSNNNQQTCYSNKACNSAITCDWDPLPNVAKCSETQVDCKLAKVCKDANNIIKICDKTSPIGQPDVAGACGKICQNNNALTCAGNVNQVDPTGACGKICQNNNAIACTANVGQADVACGKVCQNNNNVTCTANPGQPDMACGGTCVGGTNNGLPCTTNIPDCPNGGVCNPNAGSTCIINPAGVCIADPAGICITDPDPAKVCQSPDYGCNWNDQTVQCLQRGAVKQCENDLFDTTNGEGRCINSKTAQVIDPPIACDHDFTCSANALYCNWGNCVSPGQNPGVPGDQCVTDTDCSRCQLPKLCTTVEDCYTNICSPFPYARGGECATNGAGNGTPCGVRSDCFVNSCVNNSTCWGGAGHGNSCLTDSQCVVELCNTPIGGFCEVFAYAPIAEDPKKAILRLREIFAAQYGIWYYERGQYKPYPACIDGAGPGTCDDLAQEPFGPYRKDDLEVDLTNLWKVPDTACPGNVRPQPASGSGSYCGIPPGIFNAKWKSGEKRITIKRGSAATLTFNTRADAEQKPLKRIMIDWGDNYKQSFEFPYDAKEDTRNPHVFRHAYSKAGVYRPKGLVVDNWEWCSSGSVCNPAAGGWPLLDPQLEITVE